MKKLKIKPIGFNLLIKPVPIKETTTSGIILPDSQVQQIPKGTIVDKGAKVSKEFKIGDHVQWLLEHSNPKEFEHDGETHLLLSETGVACIISHLD
jgi:co-chaperonin GroES (HSP10)|tara:strand:- start:131 stop:418 length:288 start_codon:yes stop_codon:yes gene_type:complete